LWQPGRGGPLDAFDFTAFLLIIAPIAKEFDAPVPEVAAVSASAGSHAGKVRHFESELLAIAPFRSQVR